jgi:predicted enzyme related to lactoylglutathione lyase
VTGRFQGVLLPAESAAALIEFYGVLLGAEPAVVDGDRYAAYRSAAGTLAVAAGDERIIPSAAVVIRVDDLDVALGAALSAGGRLVRPAEEGPHEVRAVVADPQGNVVVLSQKV